MTDEDIASEFQQDELSLLETLDHVLTRGLVLAGEITIAVADIDLIFLGLNVVLTSVETANEILGAREDRRLVLQQRALAPQADESAAMEHEAESAGE